MKLDGKPAVGRGEADPFARHPGTFGHHLAVVLETADVLKHRGGMHKVERPVLEGQVQRVGVDKAKARIQLFQKSRVGDPGSDNPVLIADDSNFRRCSAAMFGCKKYGGQGCLLNRDSPVERWTRMIPRSTTTVPRARNTAMAVPSITRNCRRRSGAFSGAPWSVAREALSRWQIRRMTRLSNEAALIPDHAFHALVAGGTTYSIVTANTTRWFHPPGKRP